jgi:hypothetical protein
MSYCEERVMAKGLQSRNGALLAMTLIGALVTILYAFTQDKELATDLFKALFGLSGGNTAGG